MGGKWGGGGLEVNGEPSTDEDGKCRNKLHNGRKMGGDGGGCDEIPIFQVPFPPFFQRPKTLSPSVPFEKLAPKYVVGKLGGNKASSGIRQSGYLLGLDCTALPMCREQFCT